MTEKVKMNTEGNTYDIDEKYKSELMKEYPNFLDYLATQKSYTEILSNVIGRSTVAASTEAKFSMKLPVKKKQLIEIEYAPDGWEEYFDEYYDDLMRAIDAANDFILAGKNVYPKPENIFRAFDLVKPEDVRVIIVGQDPYHQKGVANGLAFSCNGKAQPSLKTIFKEIKRTEGQEPVTTDLEFWARQDVLLINTCLTVNEGSAGSHRTIWRSFINGILTLLLENKDFVILCLWGREAQKLVDGKANEKISFNSKKVLILRSGHPSPLAQGAANPFYGCGHFQQINEEFRKRGEPEIDWVGSYVLSEDA